MSEGRDSWYSFVEGALFGIFLVYSIWAYVGGEPVACAITAVTAVLFFIGQLVTMR